MSKKIVGRGTSNFSPAWITVSWRSRSSEEEVLVQHSDAEIHDPWAPNLFHEPASEDALGEEIHEILEGQSVGVRVELFADEDQVAPNPIDVLGFLLGLAPTCDWQIRTPDPQLEFSDSLTFDASARMPFEKVLSLVDHMRQQMANGRWSVFVEWRTPKTAVVDTVSEGLQVKSAKRFLFPETARNNVVVFPGRVRVHAGHRDVLPVLLRDRPTVYEITAFLDWYDSAAEKLESADTISRLVGAVLPNRSSEETRVLSGPEPFVEFRFSYAIPEHLLSAVARAMTPFADEVQVVAYHGDVLRFQETRTKSEGLSEPDYFDELMCSDQRDAAISEAPR